MNSSTLKKILKNIRCPICKIELKETKTFKLVCKQCLKSYGVRQGIIQALPQLSSDEKFSIAKWDAFYKTQLTARSYQAFNQRYFNLYHRDIYNQIKKSFKFTKKSIYLEIGCGHFFEGQALAKECDLVIGIDYSFYALVIAKRLLEEQKIKNYLLVQGDILNIPLKDGVIDFIYGGGVIEHFKDTQSCVNELARVLSQKGVCLNTVPYLNLGALTYRQLWGNIPNFPVLREIAEFIHIKLLKGRHMIYGFEYSFPSFILKNIHLRAGFKKVKIKKLKVPLTLDFLPALLRPMARLFAENSPFFWPMVKVIAKK